MSASALYCSHHQRGHKVPYNYVKTITRHSGIFARSWIKTPRKNIMKNITVVLAAMLIAVPFSAVAAQSAPAHDHAAGQAHAGAPQASAAPGAMMHGHDMMKDGKHQ